MANLQGAKTSAAASMMSPAAAPTTAVAMARPAAAAKATPVAPAASVAQRGPSRTVATPRAALAAPSPTASSIGAKRPPTPATATASATFKRTTKRIGDDGEDAALEHLQGAGLVLLARNYRTPGRGGGEIDLVMREPASGTLVFVEVRRRAGGTHGGAGGSITFAKQRRIVFAARHYLMSLARLPPCRFDVVLIEQAPEQRRAIDWIQSAFDAA